jgi:DNA-binding NtrC family response regulator
MPQRSRILIVEDEPEQLRLYRKALREYQVTWVTCASAAVKSLETTIPDLIILDHVLAHGERGAEFIPALKARAAHVPIVVVSGTLDLRGQIEALQGPLAASFILEKPISLETFVSTVKKALGSCGMGEAIAMLRSMEKAEKIESNEPERRFTERLHRQHEILNRVRKSGERPNVSALSREFNVARKTIQRDLHDLVKRGQLEAALFPDWEKAGDGSCEDGS